MIPHTLTLSGFLSYLDPVVLDFSAFELACISGANGAGKSSLLDAITWALFGNARARGNDEEALIHTAAERAQVEFVFEYENALYKVTRSRARGKNTLLEFLIHTPSADWKVLTQPGVRATEEFIRKTLRLDYDTFINASFFLQGKADQFAIQPPGKRKELLSSILGLEIWEDYRKEAARRVKLAELAREAARAALGEVENELASEPALKSQAEQQQALLQAAEAERKAREGALENARRAAQALASQKTLLELLASQARSASQKNAALQTSLNVSRAQLEASRERLAQADAVEAAYADWQALAKQVEKLQSLADRFSALQSARQQPLADLAAEEARLRQETLALQQREREAAALAREMPGLESEIALRQIEVEKARQAQTDAADLQSGMDALQEESGQLKARNERLRQEMDELKARIDTLNNKQGGDCPTCGQPLLGGSREALISSLTAQGKALADDYRSAQKRQVEITERVQQLQKTLQTARTAALGLAAATAAQARAQDRLQQAQAAQQDWQENGQPRLAEIGAALHTASFAPQVRAQLTELDLQTKNLGYDAAAHQELRTLEQNARAAREAHVELEKARSALTPLEREIASLTQQLESASAEAQEKQNAWQAAQSQYEQQAGEQPDLVALELSVNDLQAKENRLRTELGGTRSALARMQELRARFTDLAAERDGHAQRLTLLKQLEDAFSNNGIPALLIEQALPEIETQANIVLDRLSNGSMSVRFETQREKKDKKDQGRIQSLDILISDGSGFRSYELFSGGEAFRINFAIRLALSRVLAHRAGARLQLLVIDEGFGSQDADGRQRLVEAITLVRPDFAKILVITHMDELKDAFPTRVEVSKTARGSMVEVLA